MEVAAVDEGDVDRQAGDMERRLETAEAAADDNDMGDGVGGASAASRTAGM